MAGQNVTARQANLQQAGVDLLIKQLASCLAFFLQALATRRRRPTAESGSALRPQRKSSSSSSSICNVTPSHVGGWQPKDEQVRNALLSTGEDQGLCKD